MKLSLCKPILILTVILLVGSSVFSQAESNQGIELFEKGDYRGAIEILRKNDTVKDLYYLGAAYEKINEPGKAKDIFKKSFAESCDIFLKKFSEWRKVNREDQKQKFSDFLREVKLNNQIGLAAAQKALSLKSNIFQTNEWRIKAKILSDTLDSAKSQDDIYSFYDPSITAVKITEKPRANFPKDLSGVPFTRSNQSPNKPIIVLLFIVFGADGAVKTILPADDLIDAFTTESLKAANNIKFNPATKDHKPITSFALIEYSFTTG